MDGLGDFKRVIGWKKGNGFDYIRVIEDFGRCLV